ncbi:MAG: flagellar assembly peptidoglycan hydrolase FlgJ [Polaromonas sp.]|jgi:flagellar protein FlgJ
MIRAAGTSVGLAADARGLGALKYDAARNDPAAIRETAKQFESLFMRELLKSMREATMKSGLLDSSGGDLGTDLLDQQLAQSMSGRPGGLSDLIAKQLAMQMGGASSSPSRAAPQAILTAPQRQVGPAQAQAETTQWAVGAAPFVQRHQQAAEQVARSSGIPAGFMLGQAGHETGWGRAEIMKTDGTRSHNLFGIKADPNWKGPVAEITTTEFIDGQPRKLVARFRAYESYEASFRDYARLINESPRYAKARQSTGSVEAYATHLQQAGYATDPAYGSKLSRAISAAVRLKA